MPIPLGSSDLPLEEALERALQIFARDFSADEHPDLKNSRIAILKRGRNVSKVAKVWGIRNRHTQEYLRDNLVIVTLRVTKVRGIWEFHPEHSITLEGRREDDEIRKLYDFIAATPGLEGTGEFMVINAENIDSGVGQLINAISNSDQTAELMGRILSWAHEDKDATEGLVKLSSDDPTRSQALIAALNYGRYSHALQHFKEMIEQNLLETEYQTFLEENYWMFGSEYAELIENRNLVNRMQLDFPLRRTVDGYLEIIEIKRPSNGASLFRRDPRKNLTPTAELSESITQAQVYLANIDADEYRILVNEELEVEKVRAKIVIGRDGDAEQTRRLRQLNAHTNRIEVITFDQLARVAQRILEIMVEQNPLLRPEEPPMAREMSVDDIPF